MPAPSFRLSPRYMVDAADQEKIEASKNELHNLLDKPQLQGIPVSSPNGVGGGPTGQSLGAGQEAGEGQAPSGWGGGTHGEADSLARPPWTKSLPSLLCRS